MSFPNILTDDFKNFSEIWGFLKIDYKIDYGDKIVW